MTLLDEFLAIFGVWEVARPFVTMMVDEQEMELVVRMQDQSMTTGQAADLLGLSHEEASSLLQRAYSRCIVNKTVENGAPTYSVADFYGRLDHFAKYENWDDIPAENRKAINRRFLDAFIDKHRPNVERKMRGLAAENALPNDTVLLLSEVEEMLDAATHIVVQPCDCRRLGQNCDLPVEACIWLDDGAREALDRGYGRRLTREEAKELVRWADKRGLMHTADSEWQTRGLHAICNCCACDCYPFRAAQELGSKGAWPKSHYVAAHDRALCDLCGACVKRCHFEAFYHDGSTVDVAGKLKENVLLDPEKCWGCGLCANTCPEGAIVMERI
ncbi:MAG: NAD(P)H-quinone oxidoreductase subunit I, chloroplastic [Anaerolineales bacterium]|nr:NAD(P)H-quinone oxidoreductase subunit I, chloroplastic [Anaerolineales bacterium]